MERARNARARKIPVNGAPGITSAPSGDPAGRSRECRFDSSPDDAATGHQDHGSGDVIGQRRG